MRVSLGICVALTPAALSARPAFISIAPAARRCSSSIRHASEAEGHLEEMKETWSELQQKEKAIAMNKDKTEPLDFVEEMIETAIEYTHTKEQVEEEHASSAHKKLEKALRQEDALEAAKKEVHHDADYADEVLNTYETVHILEDVEERREMAVSDISHHVEDYVEERLHEAKEAELKAKEEEEGAKASLEQLQHMEEDLKATLEDIKAFKEKEQTPPQQ